MSKQVKRCESKFNADGSMLKYMLSEDNFKCHEFGDWEWLDEDTDADQGRCPAEDCSATRNAVLARDAGSPQALRGCR